MAYLDIEESLRVVALQLAVSILVLVVSLFSILPQVGGVGVSEQLLERGQRLAFVGEKGASLVGAEQRPRPLFHFRPIHQFLEALDVEADFFGVGKHLNLLGRQSNRFVQLVSQSTITKKLSVFVL